VRTHITTRDSPTRLLLILFPFSLPFLICHCEAGPLRAAANHEPCRCSFQYSALTAQYSVFVAIRSPRPPCLRVSIQFVRRPRLAAPSATLFGHLGAGEEASVNHALDQRPFAAGRLRRQSKVRLMRRAGWSIRPVISRFTPQVGRAPCGLSRCRHPLRHAQKNRVVRARQLVDAILQLVHPCHELRRGPGPRRADWCRLVESRSGPADDHAHPSGSRRPCARAPPAVPRGKARSQGAVHARGRAELAAQIGPPCPKKLRWYPGNAIPATESPSRRKPREQQPVCVASRSVRAFKTSGLPSSSLRFDFACRARFHLSTLRCR